MQAMANVLFLAHRLPYPPDKGDKIHTYHVLRHLAQRHRVLLGTVVDDPDDERHLPAVRSMCAEMHAARLRPAVALVRALGSFVRREAFTFGYFRDGGLGRWVRSVARRERPDVVLLHASSMLPYAESVNAPLVADYNDVDSAKWAEYGRRRRGPLAWAFRREGRLLLEAERRGARRAHSTLFCTEREAALFRRLAPESADKVGVLGNGVDSGWFAPDAAHVSPYPAGTRALVFVGTMSYWPNVDAARWLVKEVLPRLQSRWPTLRLYIVGRGPRAPVLALSGPRVTVTGFVPDTRPWLQHADVAVAPMRVAPGVQNKILEAMSMACPVVTTPVCAEAIEAEPHRSLLVAADAEGLVRAIERLLQDAELRARIGAEGRRFVMQRYAWPDRLATLDARLEPHIGRPAS